MDFVSHALWGGVTFGRASRRDFAVAAGISVAPDLLTEGLFMILYLLGVGGMPGWESGHPNITDYPQFAQTLYSVTHSLIVFGAVFGIVLMLAGRSWWPLAAWGLHVAIDIPTHSLVLFPTPFLWPVSDFKVDGIGWDQLPILLTNGMLLAAAYAVWYYRRVTRCR